MEISKNTNQAPPFIPTTPKEQQKLEPEKNITSYAVYIPKALEAVDKGIAKVEELAEQTLMETFSKLKGILDYSLKFPTKYPVISITAACAAGYSSGISTKDVMPFVQVATIFYLLRR